ncbi:hypothetical protein FB446DRAFT_788647 [Lentinula raphanica]|nr:hypothetical protein FB446DRAFT_788647 [Lentinula raphanica]
MPEPDDPTPKSTSLSSSITLSQPQPIRSPTYPLATYGPYPNVYSPFSTRSGPPSPSPYGYSSRRSPTYSPTDSHPASRKSSISRSTSHSELSRNSSYRSNLNSSFRPVSIMSKKNHPSGNSNPLSERSGEDGTGTIQEVDFEANRDDRERNGDSGSSAGETSSTKVSPISASSTADATNAPGAAGEAPPNPNPINGGKPARKGKAVQWLDHHLNSQAAQTQAHSNDPLSSRPVGLGLGLTPAQAADELKELKNLEERRLNEQQSELAGLKVWETQLERLANNDQRSWSPHALDEKGIDPNPFLELTSALERHQSQNSPRAGSSGFPLTLPKVPPSAYPQSDSATIEKTKIAPVISVNPSTSSGPRVHYFPPPRPQVGMTTVRLPPIETHALQDISHSHSSSPPYTTDAHTSPNRTGYQTPITASTTGSSSPDTAMRSAMLPIVPGADLPPSSTNAGGVKGFWANLRQRASMRHTNNVPGAVIYTGESAGLPSRGRPVETEGRNSADRENAVRNGEVEVHPEDVEAYAKSRAKQIVRAHTRSRRRKNKELRTSQSRVMRYGTDTEEDEFTDEGGPAKKESRKGGFFPWHHKGTKSKDYGNADIDKAGYLGTESDVERDADNSSLNSSFVLPSSGGVLGALLTLYNAQNDTASESFPPSGASTPTIHDSPVFRTENKGNRSRRRFQTSTGDATKVELESPLLHSDSFPFETTESDFVSRQHDILDDDNIASPRIHAPASPPSSSPDNEFRADAVSKRSVTATARKLLRMGTQRPTQSRNAGGVFGSLIASTGNITGAAAPTPSTLAPNVDRPGFNLTRYGYKEDHIDSAARRTPSSRGHHPGAKSLSHLDLEDGRLTDGHELERIATAPASSAPRLQANNSSSASGSKAHSDSTSPSTGYNSAIEEQQPHLLARTPVSAYIPAPTDYFSPQHGTPGPSPPPQTDINQLKVPLLSTTVEPTVTPGGTTTSSIAKRAKWTGVLKDFPVAASLHLPYAKSGKSTPATPGSLTTSDKGDWFEGGWSEKETREEREKREKRERDRKERKKRKKAELFITRHVAQIIQRQEFICKLARSMMMFGGPAHRLTSQIQATARVLDIELSCMYLPDVMLISFEDSSTGTSLIKFIKQGSVLNMGKLAEGYMIYWKVIHDDLSVSDASAALDKLMRRPPQYKWWHLMIIGGFCSAAICTVSFAGSFIDSVAVFPLGAILVGIQQLSVRNELYSNVFEITVATLFSFICGCLAATRRICYSATASSSIVLILPGFIVLSGGLEILSRNIIAGSVRLCYAVVYCLFLGFGLAIGAEAFQTITQSPIANLSDTTCAYTHNAEGPWWQRTPSKFWAFLTVPMFSFFLSMRNHQPLISKEMLICIVISCIGWVVTFFVGQHFQNQADFASAVGAFAIGMISNLAGRFLDGNAFTIMITGILFQVPSGLGNNGLLVFVSQQTDDSGNTSSNAYLSGFQTSLQLISVAIGLTIGLGIALFLSHPIPSRRRAGGVFSL